MKASWTIDFWKSGSGFSHSETVEWSHDHGLYDADESKEAVMESWYDGLWNDDHDGHHWTVKYYNDYDDPAFAEPVDTVEFWVYPEDL